MAKATVLRCDIGEEWDSEENPVRTVGVCGPKFDICAQHRVGMLVNFGVAPLLAATYVAEFDARQSVRGSTPTLAWAQKSLSSASNGETPDPTDEEVEENPDANVDLASEEVPAESDHNVPNTVDTPESEGESDDKAPRKRAARC